ncbi:hypothetical protein F4781DRAFT_440338 [Annulohypoxylon bovei var. microspora]|nr:hypothetical protein F4781DRAFT_440338 [Annulohypoxylon bovei var. microspora]
MRETITSPSDFIYQTRGSSLALSTRKNPTMEFVEPMTSSTCQQPESSASSYDHWETVDLGLPESTQTSRRATFPNAQAHDEHEGRFHHGLLCDTYSPTHRVCSVCHCRARTLDAHLANIAPEIITRQYHHPEPIDLASFAPLTNGGPPYAPSIDPGSPSQLSFTIPRIDDLAPLPDHFSSTATPGTESRTFSIHSSSSERADQVCATVQAVHDVCLQSTKTWLDTHLVNRRARASDSPLLSGQHAAPTSTDGISPHDQLRADSGCDEGGSSGSYDPIPPSTNSLLKNVSSICGMLWAGSQRDRLDVLNVERATVGTMSRLLCWAETVALGDYDERAIADGEALGRVMQAGRSLCGWLDVPDGVRAMEVLDGDVMGSGSGSGYGML